MGEEITLLWLSQASTRWFPLDDHPADFTKGSWPYLGSLYGIFGLLSKGLESQKLHSIAASGLFSPLGIILVGIRASYALSHLHLSSQVIWMHSCPSCALCSILFPGMVRTFSTHCSRVIKIPHTSPVL